MALNKQIHLYSVDTAAFYTDEEHEIDIKLSKARFDKIKLPEEQLLLDKLYNQNKATPEATLRGLRKLYGKDYGDETPPAERIEEIGTELTEITHALSEEKKKLKDLLNRYSGGARTLRPDALLRKNAKISIFESFLTRTLGLAPDELTDAIIIVRVYFFEVFRNLVVNGFLFNGNKYVCLTASAGQIRTKKCVFIREDLLKKYEKTLMCGLSVNRINELGGCNTNKYLAYLALCNSATDEWQEFDIDKSIVVDDFETNVRGIVDYIDNITYEIARKEMDVPITHTDGCGMVLPHLSFGKNFMVRMPWMKGLLAAFAFDDFVREYGGNPVVKDIYGKEHDILAEGIEVIFTKSQFKMWKYYDSWDQYKSYYKKYGCTAGICNMEEDSISNATLNYQMLQTLCDLTDNELTHLSKATNNKLTMLSEDRATKLKVLGATEDNENKTAAQECLLLYPELLQDVYYRDELKNMKDSIEKWAWCGKLDVYGKYLFVIPDLFAFCQHLFLGKNNPSGLLRDGEVYAALFSKCEKLDCLRSPHLYREHPVRTNVADNEMCQKWFSARGVYTSCHDLISKVLQFDNDGDRLLVCGDKVLVAAAERNMEGIVPLYYEMPKAGASEVTSENIYNGMVAAYTGGNIGIVSNTITKIWNSANPDINLVKQLCLYNNFVIDFAKTLYKPNPPELVKNKIKAAMNGRLPHFFIYAKNKNLSQVEVANDSCTNRLKQSIPKHKFKFRPGKGGKFDYHMLMGNPTLIWSERCEEIANEYQSCLKGFKHAKYDTGEFDNSHDFQFYTARETMLSRNENRDYIVDSIILWIFSKKKSKRKVVFWGAFGDIVLDNIRRNLSKDDTVLCARCLGRYDTKSHADGICPYCGFKHNVGELLVCEECGTEFYSNKSVYNSTNLCSQCYEEYRRKYKSDKEALKRSCGQQ